MKNKTLLNIIPFVVVILGITFMIALTLNNRERGIKSATYNRFVSCTLSIPPVDRTQSLIDRCWGVAERDTGAKVNHFQEIRK